MAILPMTRAEIQAIYDTGPEAVISLVERLLAIIAEQQVVITQLTARVQRLEEQLARNSQNSSKPPGEEWEEAGGAAGPRRPDPAGGGPAGRHRLPFAGAVCGL
jgi:predicted ATP-grasp superfamily ATP-dependent carboligase